MKTEISPVWGKLEIKFPVRTKETKAIIMVLLLKRLNLKYLQRTFTLDSTENPGGVCMTDFSN